MWTLFRKKKDVSPEPNAAAFGQDGATQAGISRGTLPHVDTMLLVSDCSRRGVQAAARIAEMITDLELKPGTVKLIVNRAPNGELNAGVAEEIQKFGLELAGVLPQEELVYSYDCEGKPSSRIPDETPVKRALSEIMQSLNVK